MQNSTDRNLLIDVLRAVSILLVILAHVQLRVPFENTSLFLYLPKSVWSFFFKSGNEGVRIFFVISGFLITSTSLKRWDALEKINFRRFYQIRFARIAPCLIGLLVLLSIFHFLEIENFTIRTPGVTYLQALLSAVTFHVNWLEGRFGYLPGAWDILWSLSVEEAFYLFFPFVCLTFKRPWFGFFILTIFVVAGPFSRVMNADNPIWQSKAYLSCMDSISIGCLGGYLINGKKISKSAVRNMFWIGVSILVIILLFKKEEWFSKFVILGLDKTVLSLAVVCLLISSLQFPLSKLSHLLAPLAALGKLSYEIYLIHMFAVFGGVALYQNWQASHDQAYVLLISVVLASGATGYLIEKIYSVPLNKLLRK